MSGFVTDGQQIRDVLLLLKSSIARATDTYQVSLKQYDDEDLGDPLDHRGTRRGLQYDYVLIMEMQQAYNRMVSITVGDKSMLLSTAVKMIGILGEDKNLLRKALKADGSDNWYGRNERTSETIVKKVMVPRPVAESLIETAEKEVTQMRRAIGRGNQEQRELTAENTGLPQEDFDRAVKVLTEM